MPSPRLSITFTVPQIGFLNDEAARIEVSVADLVRSLVEAPRLRAKADAERRIAKQEAAVIEAARELAARPAAIERKTIDNLHIAVANALRKAKAVGVEAAYAENVSDYTKALEGLKSRSIKAD